MVRRLVWLAFAAAAACSDLSKLPSGPTDSFYRPAGIGVYAGRLVVASSNADLRWDGATGGSVISVDPAVIPADPAWAGLVGGINIESFAGQMAIADPADPRGPGFACPSLPGALALVPVRGADLLYRIPLSAAGAPSCDGCALRLTGGTFADAYSVGVACSPPGAGPAPIARAYVGYLRAQNAAAWISQVDLVTGEVRSQSFGLGQVRSFAYDSGRKRLYAAQAPQGIRWIDLSDGCKFDAAELDGGCHGGAVSLPQGLEARAIALSRPDPTRTTRLYVLARVFDPRAAAYAGVRVGDVDGVLLVMEPVDDLAGQTKLQLVKPPIHVGYGPIALALLPGRTGRRDVVAALTVDDPVLLLFDDDNDAQVVIARDSAATGHPWLGTQTFGLAVDPVPAAGIAHVYVGSFQENFVTQIEVDLADIERTQVPPAPSGFRHLLGGKP